MADSVPSSWQSLLEHISSNVPQSLVNDIHKEKSLAKKVEICYNFPLIHSSLKHWLNACLSKSSGLKNAEYSALYREKGNTYCKRKEHIAALKYYNKALMYAPKGSEELKSAYGNRSHVLLQVNRCQEAIKDIDRALEGDKPTSRYMNLLLRKHQAFTRLGRNEEAKTVVDELFTLMDCLPDERMRRKILTSLDEMKKISHSNTASDDRANVTGGCSNFPNVKFEENRNFRYASKSIKLMRNEIKGRHVVANEPIKVGDVLFAERPFAFVVLPNMVDKYCSFCCKRIFAPVPCEDCPQACYCDERCRREAVVGYHSMECRGLEACFSVGIVHLALRVSLIGMRPDQAAKYEEVMALVSHLSDLQPPDLFSYSVTATLLVIFLESGGRLFRGEEDSLQQKLMDVGGLLLLHIGQLVCNGHAITDMEESGGGGAGSSLLVEDQVRVATAIYPSASMMNHSCRPNIINSFFDTLLVVRATENLKKGEEVFNCYGPMVYNTDFMKRQELLKSQYFFTCDCTSCKKKEGPISDKFFCKKCNAPITLQSTSCENCSTAINKSRINELNESDTYYKKGSSELEKGNYEEAVSHLLLALKMRKGHCHNSHRKLLECRDALAQAYAMNGKEELAFTYLEQNVQGIQNIYGNISIELGQEIMKLLSITTSLRDRNSSLSRSQRGILEKSINYGNKGLLIFKLSYGDWHPRYHLMEKHLNYLKQCVSGC